MEIQNFRPLMLSRMSYDQNEATKVNVKVGVCQFTVAISKMSVCNDFRTSKAAQPVNFNRLNSTVNSTGTVQPWAYTVPNPGCWMNERTTSSSTCGERATCKLTMRGARCANESQSLFENGEVHNCNLYSIPHCARPSVKTLPNSLEQLLQHKSYSSSGLRNNRCTNAPMTLVRDTSSQKRVSGFRVSNAPSVRSTQSRTFKLSKTRQCVPTARISSFEM